jgi:very-short-patch-repair endonuclease
MVAGFEVDAWWPGSRLAVELDSYEYHGTRAAFERDRERDAVLQLEGYRVLRVTDRRLKEQPCDLATTIRALLGQLL